MKKVISTALFLCILLPSLTGCGQTQSGSAAPAESGTTVSELASVTAAPAATDAEMFTDRDNRADYDPDQAIRIDLNGSSAQSDSDRVRVSGSTVTMTEEGVYLISGTLEDGMLIVDAPDTAKLQLVFDGADINSSASAPLYIREADKVFVTLTGENFLSNGGSFTAVDESNIDGAVFSRQDLTFNGSGSLTVSSPAGHGIVCNDDLVFTGGSFDIDAAAHAIDANDSVRIRDAAITARAGKDGIHAEHPEDSEKGFVYIASGSLRIESDGDGISAGAWLYTADGTVDILAGGGYENGTKKTPEGWGMFGPGGPRHDGTMDRPDRTAPPEGFGGRPGHGGMPGGNMPVDGMPEPPRINETDTSSDAASEDSSMKGLKADGDLLIEGGNFSIDAADDAVHSNSSVTIRGGSFEIASGDDGVHADGTLTVTAGTIHITHSYEGLEALHLAIEGGEIDLTATDDGLNAAGGTAQSGMGGRNGMSGGPAQGSSECSIVISGGTISINASGDGIDSNGTLEITGGYITVTGPTQGDTSILDFDVSGTISDGTFIGTGSSFMFQTFSDSTQGVISANTGTQSAGTEITLTDAAGSVILTHVPELEYEAVIISDPALKSGENYTLSVGGSTRSITAE